MLSVPNHVLPPLQPISPETNYASGSSEQAGHGHIQLKLLQRHLRETPLSNQQLDKTMRTELETRLILIVRFNLKKATPAYQEESAQMIINNWNGLSDETKTLITTFCIKHLQEPDNICKHYKKTLGTILEKTSSPAPTTIHTQTPEEIAPSTSEIQEESSTLPEVQQQTTHRVQWLDEKTPGKSLTKVLGDSFPFAPKYKQGNKIRWFENKEWRTLKNELKQKYVETQWGQFEVGASSANAKQLQERTRSAMLGALTTIPSTNKLRNKAEKYINKKATKALYQLDEQGHGFFRTKGTTLHSRIYRCAENYYQLLTCNTKETQEAIKTQQGQKYTGRVFLGSGAAGRVQLAKNLTSNRIVAAKIADTTTIQHEHTMLNKLPSTGYFSTIRDYVHNPKVPGKDAKESILFMDYQARGTLLSVTKKLSRISVRSTREKATKTLARQLIEAVDLMHNNQVYHRDIKPENILFSNKGSIVITDFGTARQQEDVNGRLNPQTGKREISPFVGTEIYAAPEERHEVTPRNVRKTDYYSLGQTLLLALHKLDIQKNPTLWVISNSLIHRNPQKRPTPEDLLKKDYFKSDIYSKSELLQVLETGRAPVESQAA